MVLESLIVCLIVVCMMVDWVRVCKCSPGNGPCAACVGGEVWTGSWLVTLAGIADGGPAGPCTTEPCTDLNGQYVLDQIGSDEEPVPIVCIQRFFNHEGSGGGNHFWVCDAPTPTAPKAFAVAITIIEGEGVEGLINFDGDTTTTETQFWRKADPLPAAECLGSSFLLTHDTTGGPTDWCDWSAATFTMQKT